MSGMITRTQASRLADRNIGTVPAKTLNAKDLIAMSAAELGQIYGVSAEDKIYRVFNQTVSIGAKRLQKHRVIVIGVEGDTVKLNLNGRASEQADILPLVVGDRIRIDDLIFDSSHQTLYSTVASNMQLIELNTDSTSGPSRFNGVVDSVEPSSISPKEELVIRAHDDSGSVIVAVSDHQAVSDMKKGDAILIEFCSIREKGGWREIFANRDSRILNLASCTSSRIRHTP